MKLDSLFEIECGSKVYVHPYRTAVVCDVIISMDRESDAGRELENTLAEAAKVEKDNHVVYTIEKLTGAKLHFMCTDFKIRIGTEIKFYQ